MPTSTEPTTVELLASWTGRGAYDMRRQSRVSRRQDKTYLVHDFYNGETEMRGGQYRPCVYEVPPALVDRVVRLIADGDAPDLDDEFRGHATKIRTLEYDVIGDGLLKAMGEQGAIKWTTEL